jgi:hypothetical protein
MIRYQPTAAGCAAPLNAYKLVLKPGRRPLQRMGMRQYNGIEAHAVENNHHSPKSNLERITFARKSPIKIYINRYTPTWSL